MKTVLSVIKHDILTLLHNPVVLIVLLGLAVLPSLYAWVNIYACWDPYGNTGALQVAVVSNDTGYRVDGVDMNLGDSIVDDLHSNDKIGWQFVDEEVARNGVRSGKYYAAVVIPQNFSKDIFTYLSDGMQRPSIEYYCNEKKNAIATKITNTGINTLQTTINEQFISTLSSAVLDMMNFTESNYSEFGSSLTGDITDSLTRADTSLEDLSVSVDLLIETARSAQELIAASQALLPDLNSTVNDSLAEINSLQLLTGAGKNTSDALTASLGTLFDNLDSNGDALLDDLQSAANNVQSSAEDAAQALDRAASTAGTAADSVQSIHSFLSRNQSQLLDMAQKLSTVLRDLQNAGLSGVIPGGSSIDPDQLYDDLKAALDDLDTSLTCLHSDLISVSSDASAMAETLRKTGALPAADLAALRGDITSLKSDFSDVRKQYNSSVSPLMDQTISRFYTCLNGLTGMLNTTNENLPKLNNVLVSTDSSLEHSIAALGSTQTLISSSRERIGSILDDLNSVTEDAQFAKLMDLIRENPDSVSSFLSSPVQLDTISVYSVENYGSAMAPFYSILAIWVGGLLLCSILKTTVKEDDKLKNIRPIHAYFGRYFLFGLVSVMQAVIICLGDLYFLKIQCLHPAMFIFAGAISAVVYSLLMYTLTASFRDVGKAIAIVIMVLQVAGSGGTYPVEVLPAAIRAVNPYLPFTFAINAMRECVAGTYANAYWVDLSTMCAIYIPISLFVGIILRHPVIWLMNFFERQVEHSGLM